MTFSYRPGSCSSHGQQCLQCDEDVAVLLYETPFGSIPAQSFAQSLCARFWTGANQITTWGHEYANEHISWAKTLRNVLKPCSKSLPKDFAQSLWAKSLRIAMQIMVKHVDEKKDWKY